MADDQSSPPCSWGTWEELLLACAVKKHGTDQWTLVSAELQSRSCSLSAPPSCFTPEACRSEYYAIKDRYSRDHYRRGDLADDMPWFEELRKLRVAELRREVEHYNSSIGSLEIKLKRLKSERGKSSQIGVRHSGKTVIGPVTHAFPADGSRPVGNPGETLEGQIRGGFSASSRDAATHRKEEAVEESGVQTSESLAHDLDGHIQGDGPVVNRSSGHAHAFLKEGDGEPVASLQAGLDPKDVGGNSAEVLAGSHDADVGHPLQKCIRVDAGDRVRGESKASRILGGEDEVGAIRARTSGAILTVSEQPFEDGAKLLDSGGERKELAEGDLGPPQTPEDGDLVVVCKEQFLPETTSSQSPLRTLQNFEKVTSPQHKHTSSLKHRRGVDETNASAASGNETCPIGERKDMACSVSGDRAILGCKQSMPVESADSTEGKQLEEVPSVSETKKASLAVQGKEKKELKATSKAAPAEIKGGHQSGSSREVVSRFEVKPPSTSSTETSEFHEVWGESAEVIEQVKKKERVTGCGRKRKLKKSIAKDLVPPCKAERDTDNVLKLVEMRSVMSHEGSDSTHNQGDKEGEEYDAEAWHQMERLSGDSRVEKSEVGSFVDGSEDLSPMSRRNRREPKVSGKLIPLLECLRTVCAHKCALLFKHNQESQGNPQYYRLIRAHIDLGMIRSRLEEGQYSGSLSFFRDLLLMVNNALVYYSKDTQEYVAAVGLRDCITKEMANVFETEALLKKEGPSFRKRDSKLSFDATKPKHSPSGKNGKRKGLKHTSANDTDMKDVPTISKEQPITGTSMDGHYITAGSQNVAVEVKEAKAPDEGTMGAKNTQKSSTEAQASLQSETLKGYKMSEGLKMDNSNSACVGEAKELRDSGSIKANTLLQQGKVGGKNPDHRNLITKKKGSLTKAIDASKTSAILLNKDAESNVPKAHATVQPSDTPQEPVKRGVGRPPKHSQQQVSQKAKEVEAPNPPRKRVRR